MLKSAKIYVAGHTGLVGSALVRSLEKQGFNQIITRSHRQLDLLNQTETHAFFESVKPDYVFCAAAKVGGILANSTQKADFIYENLVLQNNVIHAAYLNKVKKLLFLGSSCIYPRESKQPIAENALLTGPLESTNDAYAVAKIAGVVMCQSYNQQYGTHFMSVMPTNLYGQNDNFNLSSAHVLPALMRKFYEAKINNQPTITLWGTGSAKREFMLVDDMADACVFLMNQYDGAEIVNIGTGEDISIAALAQMIKKIVGYTGTIKWDHSKPDGMPRKLLDVSRLHSLGWKHQTSLETGLQSTYDWFVQNYDTIRR